MTFVVTLGDLVGAGALLAALTFVAREAHRLSKRIDTGASRHSTEGHRDWTYESDVHRRAANWDEHAEADEGRQDASR